MPAFVEADILHGQITVPYVHLSEGSILPQSLLVVMLPKLIHEFHKLGIQVSVR